MGSTYDKYVWRLFSEAPYDVFDVVLPHDLEWVDEFSWNPVSQDIKISLTGSIFINEAKQLSGRPITLQGKDDMAWILRPTAEKLLEMRNTSGLKMTLQYLSASHDTDLDSWTFGTVYITHSVLFDQSNIPLDLESVKRFGNFEQDSWYKINNIKFLEIGDTNPINPC